MMGNALTKSGTEVGVSKFSQTQVLKIFLTKIANCYESQQVKQPLTRLFKNKGPF